MNMNNDEHQDHHHLTSFSVGERISYFEKQGKISRVNIMGLRPCCCIEVEWDNNSMKQILQLHQIKDVVKL